MIAVETIQFNHDLSSATHDALNVRRDTSAPVILPEWRRDACADPEDSPAAYSAASIRSNAITIQVTLSCTDPDVHNAEIRVPGHVKERTISFPASSGGAGTAVAPTSSTTGPEFFELINPPAAHARVGVQDIEWRWEYRVPPGQRWHRMATGTRHRLYTVLDVPNAPWAQSPSSTQTPWVSALDYACHWAKGARTADEVAHLITENVYALGPAVVQYDSKHGATHYSNPHFDLTAFLDRLGGGPGNGQYVNCTDCATIVSTFANLVGGDLWQSKMGYGFQLNPLLVIGSKNWKISWHSGFHYHEVAWSGACTATDELWDACLKVNRHTNPTRRPFDPMLPSDVQFLRYQDRLAPPCGQPNCQPRPGSRRRRHVV
jgi:hypothetical protein